MESSKIVPIFWQAAYAILLVAVSALFLTTWYSVTSSNTSLKLIFLALLILTLRRWTGALLLALVQLHLLYLSPWIQHSFGAGGELVWIFLSLAMLSLVSRYRTLQELHGQSSSSSTRQLTEAVQAHKPSESDSVVCNIRGVLRQMVRSAVILGLCIIAAYKILEFIPLERNKEVFDTIGEFRIVPAGFRIIVLGISLFAAWLVAWLVINEITWRTRLPSQASVYLRSVFLNWSHRDLQMVIKRRMKVRRKRARKIKPTKGSNEQKQQVPFAEDGIGLEGRIL